MAFFVLRNVVTVRNEVAKVMFLQVSVILFRGGEGWVVSQHALQVVSKHALHQGECAIQACLAAGGGLPWGGVPAPRGPTLGEGGCSRGSCLLLGGACSGGGGDPPGSRQHASYWNAFLFFNE